MIKKQNLRINVLAAAVLSMTAVGAVHAAGLPTREPVRQASTAEPGAQRIIVKYRTGTAAASDRSAKLSTVQSALTRASLSGGTTRASTLGPQVVRVRVRRPDLDGPLVRLQPLGESLLALQQLAEAHPRFHLIGVPLARGACRIDRQLEQRGIAREVVQRAWERARDEHQVEPAGLLMPQLERRLAGETLPLDRRAFRPRPCTMRRGRGGRPRTSRAPGRGPRRSSGGRRGGR